MTLDFDTSCPQCDIGSSVRFDLASYLMRRLAGERPFLLRETHMLRIAVRVVAPATSSRCLATTGVRSRN